MGLIGVVVAVAIAGMLAVVLSNIFSDSFKAQHHMELASDREAIKRNFLETVNCGLTMKASGGCTPNAAVVVNRKDASGATIPMTTTTCSSNTHRPCWEKMGRGQSQTLTENASRTLSKT